MTSAFAWVCRGLRISAAVLAAVFGWARGQPAALQAPIVLPPFLVEGPKAPAWLYGSEPGFEVLSRCSTETTKHVLRSVWHSRAQFDRMLDGHFRVQRSLPVIIILSPQEWKPALPPGAVDLLHLPSDPRRGIFAPEVRFFPNLYLGSSDLQVVFFVEPGHVTRYPDALTPAAAERELQDSVPPLPPWFAAGFAEHYGRASWVGPGQNQRFGYNDEDYLVPGDDTPVHLSAKAADWVSPSETESFRHDADRPRWLLPLPELLAEIPPAEPQRLQVWRSESELLVRWLLTRVPHGRDALWHLAEAGAQAPLTEATFQRIVGYNYSDAFDALSDFLSEAVSTDVDIPTAKLPDPPYPVLHLARHEEITRLKAAWEEAEAVFIQQNYPALLKIYVDQAQATLDAGLRYGPETPETLATRGLLALEAKDTANAQRYLEAAMRARVVRPWAYYELAALRLRAAQAHPRGHRGRLTPAQADSVLEPLWVSRDQKPQPLTAFLLAAKTAALCESEPDGRFAVYLAEGRALYPLDGGLADYSRK